jgi:single-strand DNA-binding protein
MSINKVILVGNVGKDPVIRYFDKGVAKAAFPLATSETYTNQQGETITSTEWHNIVLWRSLAEVAEKTVKKGSLLYIVGKIKTRSYVDKDGNNKYITEILADTLLVLDKKQSSGNSYAQSGSGVGEAQDRGASHADVNEPSAAYQATDEDNTSGLSKNSNEAIDDFDSENLSKGGSDLSQSEDDLPF